MSVFDNCLIADLPIVLKKESLLQRYYELIPVSVKLCKSICAFGINDVSSFLQKVESISGLEEMTNKTGIESEYFQLLQCMLLFQRFKPIRLKKIHCFNEEYINQLASINIKDTGSLILACKSIEKRNVLSELTSIPIEQIIRMVCLADLMRLPGVKNIRASLYFDAGFDCLETIAEQNPLEMRETISKYIRCYNVSKSSPLPKEVSTQVAWAKVYPKVVEF